MKRILAAMIIWAIFCSGIVFMPVDNAAAKPGRWNPREEKRIQKTTPTTNNTVDKQQIKEKLAVIKENRKTELKLLAQIEKRNLLIRDRVKNLQQGKSKAKGDNAQRIKIMLDIVKDDHAKLLENQQNNAQILKDIDDNAKDWAGQGEKLDKIIVIQRDRIELMQKLITDLDIVIALLK
ncbi:MAG: hypothetical protein ACM3UZ_04545 [Acidobacteriota bacterium]